MMKYKCNNCGYIYDLEIGDPIHDIEPFTEFGNLPLDWNCPLCSVPREIFEPAGYD